MSEDIRKMINKVKNFKQFVNENIDNVEYLYHGTSLKNTKNIIQYGFSDDTYWGDKNTAEQYANSYSDPILIRLPKNEIFDQLEPNTTLINFYEDNAEYDEDYKDVIDNWENSNKTIVDSLDIFGSAILPPSNIQIDKSNLIEI